MVYSRDFGLSALPADDTKEVGTCGLASEHRGDQVVHFFEEFTGISQSMKTHG